jgi:hypothetical protein
MGAADFLIALIVVAVGCVFGWHANRARVAHGDVKTTRGRIKGYRQTRLKSGLLALGLVAVALIVVHVLLSG